MNKNDEIPGFARCRVTIDQEICGILPAGHFAVIAVTVTQLPCGFRGPGDTL